MGLPSSIFLVVLMAASLELATEMPVDSSNRREKGVTSSWGLAGGEEHSRTRSKVYASMWRSEL